MSKSPHGATRFPPVAARRPREPPEGEWATVVNGWRYPPPTEGRAGDDFLLRAADQSLAGIVANDPAEAVYLVNMDDADGNKLSGEARYELPFSGADLPPVDAFWSLTLYKADMNLVPNAANRYSLGDRTPGLQTDAGGGITIFIQHGSPARTRSPTGCRARRPETGS